MLPAVEGAAGSHNSDILMHSIERKKHLQNFFIPRLLLPKAHTL
jgi:hypothetical protein